MTSKGILQRKLLAETIHQAVSIPCVPESMKEEIIKMAHTRGGHMGIHAMIDRLRRHFFFPKLQTEVEDFVKGCKTCQQKLRANQPQKQMLVSPTCGYPFQRLHIDLVGPLNPSRVSGAKWILTCCDTFSKWPEAYVLKDTTSKTNIETLEQEIFARYGYPEAIHSNQGPQFTSQLFRQLQAALGIRIMDTTGYNPKSNGQVERMHRDLNTVLRALVADHGDPYNWEDLLPSALFTLRTAICRSTGLAPYQILFGRDCSSLIDNIFRGPSGSLDEPGLMDYLRKLRKRILSAHKYARKHLSMAVRRQRRQYHKERKDFHAGTKVWLFTPTVKKGSSTKLTCYWSGPWIVSTEPTSRETLLQITPDPLWAKQLKNNGTQVVSIDRLKLYNNAKAVRIPESEEDLEMDDNEFGENITVTATSQPQSAETRTSAGRSGNTGGGGSGGTDGVGNDNGARGNPTGPPTTANPSPSSWRATPRQKSRSSSRSSTSYSSDASSTSKVTEKDLLDSTTASEVPGESFLLTPPRFEFTSLHVDSPMPMDTMTPGPSRAATVSTAPPAAGPSPSTGAIRKRSHGATPFSTKGVIRRSETQTPVLDQSVVIPVEGIVASRPGALWARFPTRLSLESGLVLLSNTPLRRTGAMTLFSFTQGNEDVFPSNSQERLPLSSFSLGLASSAAVVPGQLLLCPKGEGVCSLRPRPLAATVLTIQTTSIACYWIQATLVMDMVYQYIAILYCAVVSMIL